MLTLRLFTNATMLIMQHSRTLAILLSKHLSLHCHRRFPSKVPLLCSAEILELLLRLFRSDLELDPFFFLIHLEINGFIGAISLSLTSCSVVNQRLNTSEHAL